VVETYDKVVRSQYETFKMPAIIVTNEYKTCKVRRSNFTCSTKNILIRDNFQCQYCGKRLTLNTATKDHVFPQSKGGKTVMQNLAASCKSCNSKKDNKTCEQANMFPKNKPRDLTSEERLECIVKMMSSRERQVWNNWLKENNLSLW
jgi:DNA-directed RNA polymerase subunit RPC12/RpoP